MTLINNVKSTLSQTQAFINQQFKYQEKLKTEIMTITQLVDQLDQKAINSRQAQDNVVLISEKQQYLKDQQGQLFSSQLNQVIINYSSSQLTKIALELQENIENIFNQQPMKSNTLTYQSEKQISQASTLTENRKPLGNQQMLFQDLQREQQTNKSTEFQRSLTPTYTKSSSQTSRTHSIEQKQVTYGNQSQIISTDRLAKTAQIQKTESQQKPYEFKSGLLFKDQLSKNQKDQQQEQIRQQQNTSSSIISRSNLFPKVEKQYAIKAHDKRISSIQIGEHCVFTSSYDKLIRVWDKITGKLISTLEGHTREIMQLKLKYETLASCGADKTIRIWKHHPRWQLIGNLKGHLSLVTSIEFLNPKQLLSGSEDLSLKIWDLEKQLEIHSMKFDFIISTLIIFNDKLYVGGDGAVLVYQCPQLQQIRFVQLHESPIQIILLTKLYLITIDKEGNIKLSDSQTYSFIKELKDDYEISSATYIPQYNFLALGLSTTNGEGKICFWSLDTLRKIKELYDNGSGVGGLGWEQPYLWSGHDNKRLESLKFAL